MISDPRHRIQYRQLWIDKVRGEIDKMVTPDELDHNVRMQVLASRMRASPEQVMQLSPAEFAIECMNHDLVDSLPVRAPRSAR